MLTLSADAAATGGNAAVLNFKAASDLMTIQSASSDALAFGTANTERLRITSGGDVGIGTSSPQDALEVENISRFSRSGRSLRINPNFGVSNTHALIETVGSGANAMALAFATNNQVERMRIDTSGNVGIGTSSPGAQLEISRSSTGGFSTFRLSNTGASGRTYEIGLGGNTAAAGYANNLYFYDSTAAALRMALDSAGNLGLGVTPSASTYKTFQLPANGAILTTGNNINFGSNSVDNGGWKYVSSSFASLYGQYSGQHQWFTAPSGTAGNAITFTQAMTLDASGNLGIGTSSPASRLHLAKAGNEFLTLERTNKSGGSGQFGINVELSSQATISYDSATPLVIGTATTPATQAGFTERARITSGGDLLVGTTSNAGVSSAAVSAGIFNSTRSAAANVCFQAWNQATSGDNKFVEFYTEGGSGTLRGSITYNRGGGLVAYNTTSDYRAKDITGPVTDPGATIDALKVYNGKMKGATVERPMLVAHEAQAITPYAVTGEKDAVNENGDPIYQQMDVSSLVPLLIAEVQSLRARVAQLEGN